MAKDVKGFMKIGRTSSGYRPVCERIKDFKEVALRRTDEESMEQAARCMDCGTPFCHWGCPVGNLIPEWNELMAGGYWKEAAELLESTNNFPEITGRVCPALCESACVLGINDDPVTIRENELAIIERAFKEGTIKPRVPAARTGKRIAVIGSGPAGLSCALQLNRAGHQVTVFEKAPELGGFMRYGIPDFKLGKWVIDRRTDLMREEGVNFRKGVNAGVDIPVSALMKDFDAICLTGGSREPRDLDIEGRGSGGIHFAVDYLTQSNIMAAGGTVPPEELISAQGKKVVVVGGGDTGADCIGTANRQGASCIVQIEVMPRPSECRTEDYPWPGHPLLLKTTSSHEEGGERMWSILTRKFLSRDGKVTGLSCVRVEFTRPDEKSCPVMKEVPGTEFEIEADLVILAIGFLHPGHPGLLTEMGLEYDKRGNVKTDDKYRTSVDKVFSAGDMHRGQSLIVWAIAEGRRAAHHIDEYLTGQSRLPVM